MVDKKSQLPQCKNLKLPESGINYALYLFSNSYGISYMINPLLNNTTSNTDILYLIDKSDTVNVITFLPLEFLDNYIKLTCNIEYKYTTSIENSLERKQLLFDILKSYLHKNSISIQYFLINNKYKNIPLILLKKPLISAQPSKTKDSSLFSTIKDDIVPILGEIIGFNINNQSKPDPFISSTKLEWMSIFDITSAVYPLTLIKNNFFFHHTILMESDNDFSMVNSKFKQTVFYKNFVNYFNIFLKSTRNYFITSILYNSHFTSLIVRKTKQTGCICMFFDSGGYNPREILLNKNYYFIELDMAIHKHNHIYYFNKIKTSNTYLYIDVLTKIISKMTNNISIFNTFELQHDKSECGMFTVLFLYNAIINDITKLVDIKKLYYTMTYIGDLLASMYRGLFFVHDTDCNNIDYYNELGIFPLKNKKYVELYDIHVKNILNIKYTADKMYKSLDYKI